MSERNAEAPGKPRRPAAADHTDQRGSRILSQAECRQLLATGAGGVGHLGLVTTGAVTVLPLNFTVSSGDVILRLAPGATLQALAEHPLVAFVVDALEADGEGRPGAWSVLVQGEARIVRDPLQLAELEALGLTPLVAEAGQVYVRIHAERISGRSFAVGALARFGMPART